MPTGSRTPDLAEVLDTAIERKLKGLRTAMPVTIDSYDATTGKASVVPQLLERQPQADGTELAVQLPKLVDVPVWFPGGGGYRLTCPVARGDLALLICSDRSMDEWRTRAGAVDPQDVRHHSMADGIALVGLRDFGTPWTGVPTDRVTLGKDGGSTLIAVGAGLIELGYPNATDFAALASKVDAGFSALKTQFDAHVHPTPIGPSGAPAVPLNATPATGSASVALKP